MSKTNKDINYTLGILDTADYTNEELYGGSTGYIKSILPYMTSQKILIIGQGINGTTPWKPVSLSDNTTFIPVADFKFPSKIPLRLKALFAYTRYLRRIIMLGCDVFYVHSPEICLPFLLFNKKIPIIYHQHGFSNTLHSSKYSYGEAKIFRKFFDIARWLIYKKASWIIMIDNIGLQQAADSGVKNKTSLLLNAVDTYKFKPNQEARMALRKHFKLHDNVYSIFNAGRIEKQKGIQRLIECIPILKSKGVRFHIFIAGDGTYKNRLLDIVKFYEAETMVTFLGRIPHEKLPDYYNMADVFVLPSEREGVPMAILESLACGTPVVANSIGGIPNILKNGKNGILLENLSKETISSSIMDVLNFNYDRYEIAKTIESVGSANAISFLNTIVERITSN